MSSVGVPFSSDLVQLIYLGSSIRLANSVPADKTLAMDSFDFPYCLPLGSHRPILLLPNFTKIDSWLAFVSLPLPLQQSCLEKQLVEFVIFARLLPSWRPARWFNRPYSSSSWTSFAWTPWFAAVDFGAQLTSTLIFLAAMSCSTWAHLIGFLHWTAPSDAPKSSPCFSTWQKPFAQYWTFSSESFVNFCQYCFIYQTFAAADDD